MSNGHVEPEVTTEVLEAHAHFVATFAEFMAAFAAADAVGIDVNALLIQTLKGALPEGQELPPAVRMLLG